MEVSLASFLLFLLLISELSPGPRRPVPRVVVSVYPEVQCGQGVYRVYPERYTGTYTPRDVYPAWYPGYIYHPRYTHHGTWATYTTLRYTFHTRVNGPERYTFHTRVNGPERELFP